MLLPWSGVRGLHLFSDLYIIVVEYIFIEIITKNDIYLCILNGNYFY